MQIEQILERYARFKNIKESSFRIEPKIIDAFTNLEAQSLFYRLEHSPYYNGESPLTFNEYKQQLVKEYLEEELRKLSSKYIGQSNTYGVRQSLRSELDQFKEAVYRGLGLETELDINLRTT